MQCKQPVSTKFHPCRTKILTRAGTFGEVVRARVKMVLTHSILGAPLGEHKAPTNFFHSDLSWASHRSSFHVFPAVFISSSMVLRQLPSGLPRCLFPGGAQDSASSGCRPFFMRRTWPSHVHRLLFTSRTMLFTPVRLQISSLHTFSCQLTLNILRKKSKWYGC